MSGTETDLYEQLAQYMNIKHPGVLYHFDLSGVYNPSHKTRNLYARLHKRAWPDMFIANQGRQVFGGLFLELKKDGVRLYKKDGSLRANEHHEEQAAVLEALRAAGYRAEFAVGLEQSIEIIDGYLL